MLDLFKELPNSKSVYLASDFHLGSPDYQSSRARERKVVEWLQEIKPDCGGLILAGDIFDFWFEYRKVVPKGFVRLLGCLADFTDSGIPLVLFTGNHDLWMKDYLKLELGAHIFYKPESFEIGNLKVHIGHGDGLGPGDHIFKFNKGVFKNKIAQWGFRWLHPDIGMSLATRWSESSRIKGLKKPDPYLGEKEWILEYSRKIESKTHHDFYIFGHRHLKLEMAVAEGSTYLNPGDWIDGKPHYIKIDGKICQLIEWKKKGG